MNIDAFHPHNQPELEVLTANVKLCATCIHARNQYGQPYTVGDPALCDAVPNLITGERAMCESLRVVGMPAHRCGLEGALHE